MPANFYIFCLNAKSKLNDSNLNNSILQYLNSVRRKASQQLWEDLTGTKLNLSVNPGYVHVSSLNNLTLQDLNSVFLHIQHCEIFFSVWLSLELRSIEFYDLLFLFIFLQIDGWILLLFQARIKQERLWLRKSQDLFRGTKQMKCISLKKVEWEPRVICLNRRLVAIRKEVLSQFVGSKVVLRAV